MKKYRTDWKIAIVFVISLGFIILGAWSVAISTEVFINSVIGMTLMIAVIILLVNVFSYVSTKGNTLEFVYLLLYRRKVDISLITEINDQPTYKVARSQFRSLYIFYKPNDAETKYIELKISIFPEDTLGRLVKDLKQANPSITLNGYAEKLMNSFGVM